MWAAILAGLQALRAALGFGERVLAAKAKSKDEEAGANRVLAKSNAEAAKVNGDVAKAALATDADTVARLREHGF